MKFSNEGESQGVSLSAGSSLKKIRDKHSDMMSRWADSRMPAVCEILGDILTYLEQHEKRPPVYLPEPRLGPREPTEEEAIQSGRQLAEVIKAAQAVLEPKPEPPRDHKGQVMCTTSGKPITPETREINPSTGMQKDYIVLCPDERAKGFVRPVRRSYKHLKCGTVTTMGQALAETYARDPYFYSGTFCCGCSSHFPVGVDGEFVWDGSEEKVGT